MREEMEAKRAAKKEKTKKRGPKTTTDDFGVDQEDLDLINENRSKHRRLR